MDLQQLNTPQQQRSEIPNTLDILTPPSRDTIQSPSQSSSVAAVLDSQSSFSSLESFQSNRSAGSQYSQYTDRDKRLQIQTALLFEVPYKKIREKLGVTDKQIWYAKQHRLTPQKSKAGKRPTLNTPQKATLQHWLQESPSHRRVPYRHIPRYYPERYVGEEAIRTAMQELGYCRRTSKKKGFSDDPKVWALRKAFAEEGITWTRERVQRQMFSDEVWAMGGAHTASFVTVLANGSETYLPECLQHKYSKAPAWMFHGCIVNGTKGPALFWEKEWGSINSVKYNEHVLSRVADFIAEHANAGYIFMQDDAPSHRSYETKINLLDRGIRWIKHPPYSPDLNLIEHVWTWMKNWIQEHYWEARYQVDKLPLDQFRGIIWEAWEAVPDSFIQSLYDSWWRRCQAVIDANGGPTKY